MRKRIKKELRNLIYARSNCIEKNEYEILTTLIIQKEIALFELDKYVKNTKKDNKVS